MSDRVPGNFRAGRGISPDMETNLLDRTCLRRAAGPAVGVVALALLAGCSTGPGTPVAGTGRPAPDSSSAAASSPATRPDGTGAGTPDGTEAPTAGRTTGRTTGGGAGTGEAPGGSADRVAVPDGVMLTAADWPAGKVLRAAGTLPTGLQPTEPAACQARTAYPSDRHRLAARTVSIASPEPESGGLLQIVVRYGPGRAAQAMAEMRRVLAACHRYRPDDVEPVWTRSYRLEAERFAGDDALLVRRADRADGTSRDWGYAISVVRVGDALVTTISEVGEGVADPAVAHRLAEVGARRAACLRTTC